MVLALIGCASVFVTPAWVPLIFALLLSLRFPAWEAILIGMLIDIMWLSGDAPIFLPLGTLTTIIIVWACEPLRRELLVGDEF
jgi:hypothetical protein